MRVHATAVPSGTRQTRLSRTWLVSTYGASVSSVRCGSSIAHTGLPASMHTPTKSGPASSTSIFSSRACMSPAWFSTASFSPASTTRDRTECEHAECVVDPLLDASGETAIFHAPDDAADERGAEEACRRQHCLDLRVRAALRRVEDSGARADREHAELEPDAEPVGVRAHAAEMIRIEAAEQPDLAVVGEADAPARGEVELFERGPALRAQAEHVEAEMHKHIL